MSAYSASVALRASIAPVSQPGASKCEVYLPDVRRYRILEAKGRLTLVIVEPTEKFGGGFVQSVGCGIDGKRGRRRWHE